MVTGERIAGMLGALMQLEAPWGLVRELAGGLLAMLRGMRNQSRAALAQSLWAVAVLSGGKSEELPALLDALRGAGASAGGVQQHAWLIWEAGQAGRPNLGSRHDLGDMLARMQQQVAAMSADDLTAALVGCSKLRGAALRCGLKRAVLALADAADLALFDPLSQQATDALYALGSLGCRPVRLSDHILRGACGSPQRLTARQILRVASALAALLPPAACARPMRALVRELARRAPEDPDGAARRPVSAAAAVRTAWAAAIADQARALAPEVSKLCMHEVAQPSWARLPPSLHAQLFQCHMSLSEAPSRRAAEAGEERGKVGGLRPTLLEGVVDACHAAWVAQQQREPPSNLQLQVFERLLKHPGLLSDCRLEGQSGVACRSIHITCVHLETNRRLAIEVDGPSHFICATGGAPDGSHWPVRGETAARDRALAADGWVVVSVPYWAWAATQRAVNAAVAAARTLRGREPAKGPQKKAPRGMSVEAWCTLRGRETADQSKLVQERIRGAISAAAAAEERAGGGSTAAMEMDSAPPPPAAAAAAAVPEPLPAAAAASPPPKRAAPCLYTTPQPYRRSVTTTPLKHAAAAKRVRLSLRRTPLPVAPAELRLLRRQQGVQGASALDSAQLQLRRVRSCTPRVTGGCEDGWVSPQQQEQPHVKQQQQRQEQEQASFKVPRAPLTLPEEWWQ